MLLITLFLLCVVSCLELNYKGWRPTLDGGFMRQQNKVSSPQQRTRDVNTIPNDCQECGNSGLYGSYNIPLIPVPPIFSQPSIQRPSRYSKKRSCDLSKTHHSFGLPTVVYHYHQSQGPRSTSRDKPDELNILKKSEILYSKKDNPYYLHIPSQPLPVSSIVYHGRAHVFNEVYEKNGVSSSLNRPRHNSILNPCPASERNPIVNIFPLLNKNILDEREDNFKFHNVNYGDKTALTTYNRVQSVLDKTQFSIARNVSNFNPPRVSTIPNPGYNPNSRRKVHIFNPCGHSPWNIMKGPDDHLESGLHEQVLCNNHATQNKNFENIANPNVFPSQDFPNNPVETKINEVQGVISELEVVTTWRPDSLNNFLGRGIVNVVDQGGDAKNTVPFDSGIIVNIPENNVLPLKTSERPDTATFQTAFIARSVEDSKDETVQDLIQDLYSINLKRMANMLFQLSRKKTVKLPKPFTVFAPSNMAFRNLPLSISSQMENDVEFLEEVLLYHIVPGHLKMSSLNGSQSMSSLHGSPLLFALRSSEDEKALVNGAYVKTAELTMGNNITVHVVDRVFYSVPTMSIESLLRSTEEYREFYNLFKKILNTTMQKNTSEDFYTIFLPSKTAMVEYLFSRVTNASKVMPFIQDLIDSHIVHGIHFVRSLENEQHLETLSPSKNVEVTILDDLEGTDKLRINTNSTIIEADILATNGVIHLIDSLLFP